MKSNFLATETNFQKEQIVIQTSQNSYHMTDQQVTNMTSSSTEQETNSSAQVLDENNELFVMDKNETKAMEELFDKLVADESNMNKPMRSQSFDAIEKWLQNSNHQQDQISGMYIS